MIPVNSTLNITTYLRQRVFVHKLFTANAFVFCWSSLLASSVIDSVQSHTATCTNSKQPGKEVICLYHQKVLKYPGVRSEVHLSLPCHYQSAVATWAHKVQICNCSCMLCTHSALPLCWTAVNFITSSGSQCLSKQLSQHTLLYSVACFHCIRPHIHVL